MRAYPQEHGFQTPLTIAWAWTLYYSSALCKIIQWAQEPSPHHCVASATVWVSELCTLPAMLTSSTHCHWSWQDEDQNRVFPEVKCHDILSCHWMVAHLEHVRCLPCGWKVNVVPTTQWYSIGDWIKHFPQNVIKIFNIPLLPSLLTNNTLYNFICRRFNNTQILCQI